jgi:transposase
MSVDEKMIDEEFYTVMTNRETGKIALLAETLTVTELNKLIATTGEAKQKVKTITADLSPTYEKFFDQSFRGATIVADKFHVVQHIVEAVLITAAFKTRRNC